MEISRQRKIQAKGLNLKSFLNYCPHLWDLVVFKLIKRFCVTGICRIVDSVCLFETKLKFLLQISAIAIVLAIFGSSFLHIDCI